MNDWLEKVTRDFYKEFSINGVAVYDSSQGEILTGQEAKDVIDKCSQEAQDENS